MTDIDPNKCTAVRVLFEGEGHQAAADHFVIQFADGGLDQTIEQQLGNVGVEVSDTDFDTETRTLTIKVGGA